MNYINGSELAGKRFVKLENGDLREVKGKFIPVIGEDYYCLSAFGSVSPFTNADGEMDKWVIKHNLVFRTVEECENYRRFLETLDKHTFEPDWNNRDQDKWCLYYDHYDNTIHTGCCSHVQYALPYFTSEEKAEAFIAEVGEGAVKCFMFDVWE